MKIFTTIGLLILIIFGITFASLNSTPVSLHYYLGTKQYALSLLLILALGIGLILGLLTTVKPLMRLKRENYKLKSRVKQIEREVENLRALPIKDAH